MRAWTIVSLSHCLHSHARIHIAQISYCWFIFDCILLFLELFRCEIWFVCRCALFPPLSVYVCLHHLIWTIRISLIASSARCLHFRSKPTVFFLSWKFEDYIFYFFFFLLIYSVVICVCFFVCFTLKYFCLLFLFCSFFLWWNYVCYVKNLISQRFVAVCRNSSKFIDSIIWRGHAWAKPSIFRRNWKSNYRFIAEIETTSPKNIQ